MENYHEINGCWWWATSIVSFDNFAEALEYSKHNPLDLAVLDIELGSENGIELARQLHIIDENINIIFITSYAQYALDAYSVDGIAYIMKPYLDEDVIKGEIVCQDGKVERNTQSSATSYAGIL